MADNPDQPIIQLGVEANTDQADSQFSIFIEDLRASFEDLTSVTDGYTNSINELADAFRNEQLQKNIDEMNAFTDATKAADDAAAQLKAQWDEIFAAREAQANGYGNTGGLIGPAQDDGSGDSADTSGGGRGGGAYAVARGLSSAGRAFNAPGLTEAGAGIYGINAIGKVGPFIDQVAESLTKMDGVLGAAAVGGEAIAGSFGAVVAVAAPFAAGFIVIAGGIALFNAEIAPAKELMGEAIASLKVYYGTIQTGTVDSVQAAIKANNDKIAQDTQELNKLKDSVANQNPLTGLIAGIFDGSTDARIKALKTELIGLQSTADGLARAADNADVKSRSFIIALDQASTEFVKNADLLKTASTQQVQDLIDANNTKVQANAIELGKLNDALDTGAITLDQYSTKVDEIDVANKKLVADTQNLNTAIADAARKREDEKRAADALKQATDDLASAQAKLTDLYAQEATLNGNYEQERLNSAADFAAQQKQTTVDFYANQYQQAQDYESKRLQETADFYANLADADAAYYQKRANEVADFNESIASTQTSFQQNQAKEIRDFNQQQANNAKDLADNIRKIERDTRDTELDEASRLDARAIAATQRAATKQITDATETYDKQRARAQEAEQQKLADQQQAENESIAKQTEAFNKKLENEQTAYETSRAKQVQAFDQKQAREDEAFVVQQRKQDEAYVKTLRNQEEAFQKQTRAQEVAYGKALYALDTQIAKEQQKATVAYQAQSDAQQGQFDLLAGQQSTANSNQLSAANVFLGQLQTTFQTGYNNIITGLSAQSNQASGAQGLGSTAAPGGGTISGITTGGFGDGGTPYLAAGDDNPKPNSWAVVGENGPELLRFGSNPPAVVSNQRSSIMFGGGEGPQGISNGSGKSGGGGNSYTINYTAADKAAFKKQLTQILEELA